MVVVAGHDLKYSVGVGVFDVGVILAEFLVPHGIGLAVLAYVDRVDARPDTLP